MEKAHPFAPRASIHVLLRRQEPSSAASTGLLPAQEHGAQITGNDFEAAARLKMTHPLPPRASITVLLRRQEPSSAASIELLLTRSTPR